MNELEAKKFRNFLEKINNHLENPDFFLNLSYGDTNLKSEIETFLTISNLESDWFLFNKLLIKISFFKNPVFDKIQNNIFPAHTEESFFNFKNFIDSLISLPESTYSNKKTENEYIEERLSSVSKLISTSLTDNLTDELKEYFSNKKSNIYTKEQLINKEIFLIKELSKYTNNITKKNLPRTTIGPLLGINTTRMTKIIGPLIKEESKQ